MAYINYTIKRVNMKNKKNEVIAKNIINIFMSEKPIEQQEKDFSELVNKEDKENLFNNISNNLLDNLLDLEPLVLINVLDKVIVNSLVNDLFNNSEYPISLQDRKKFAKEYDENDIAKGFYSNLSESLSYYKYHKARWDLQEGKLKEEEAKNYYEKNIEKVNAAFEKITKKERDLIALHIKNIENQNKVKLSSK